jgi:hypothetical protein
MSILNAITAGAGGVALSGDTSGNLTIQSAGTNVATFTSTGMVSNVGAPAFSAYIGSSGQSFSSGVWTKMQINTKEFDTANCFDATTNYRFTPTVAGYYQVNGQVAPAGGSSSITRTIIAIYKNGTTFKTGTDVTNSAPYRNVVSTLMYFNGTTDYIELYAYMTGTSLAVNNVASDDYFQAFLARSV